MMIMPEQAGEMSSPHLRRDVNGIVLVDKPAGMSSNHALQRVKRLFRARKAGHTGSLDPLASGMLPICLGEATKMAAFLLDSDKTYRFRMNIGRQTSTGDAEGEVVVEGPPVSSEECLQRALDHMRGLISQVPPMYSALKHRGQRLYRLARAGQEVERVARQVWIHELVVERFDASHPVLRVRCSKGTYVRTLTEDIARQAGTVAHVAELRRLAVAPFRESAMHTLEELEAEAGSPAEAQLDTLLLPVDAAIESWPVLELTAREERGLLCGQPVPGDPGPGCGPLRLYGHQGRFLGVGERLSDGRVVPRRLMATAEAENRAVTAAGPRVQWRASQAGKIQNGFKE